MNKRKLLVLLAVVSLFFSSTTKSTAAEDTSTADQAVINTIDRHLEPAIVSGSLVDGLAGNTLDSIFVYAYTNNSWQQIPFQIDEVSAVGEYVSTEDSLLDQNDEIVFMTNDIGLQSTDDTPIEDVLPLDANWYEIEVSNPISPTQKGWAYIVHSEQLDIEFSEDYVSFDSSNHRINGQTLSLGFATPKVYADYISLGGSGIDILDRSKLALFCASDFLCPITEEVGTINDDLIIDGPVRVILRNGKVKAYRSMLSWSTTVNIPPALPGDIQIGIDFSSTVIGSTFYNANVADVPVDGTADTVPSTPSSAWWQLSTANGTLVQVTDLQKLAGTITNHYVDDGTTDTDDTGDQQRYGETGFMIENPGEVINYDFTFYSLAGEQSNVGARYKQYAEQPLTLAVSQISGTGGVEDSTFLPIINN